MDLELPNVPGVVYTTFGRTDIGFDTLRPGGKAVTLTIRPGVVIIASNAIVVQRGSRVLAQGTDAPGGQIIFTSPTNVRGTPDPAGNEGWPGLYILGKAPISNCTGSESFPQGSAAEPAGVCSASVPSSDLANGYGRRYGGTSYDDGDSYSRLENVQIRFAGRVGFSRTAGLTLAGLGTSSLVRNVQIHGSYSSALMLLGGAPNVGNLIITGPEYRGIEVGNGYRGVLQNVVAVQEPGRGYSLLDVSDALRSTNTAGQFQTNPTLVNFTLISQGAGDTVIRLNGRADIQLGNGVVIGKNPNFACLDIVNGDAIASPPALAGDAGPPRIDSVLFSCGRFANDAGEAGVLTLPGNMYNQSAYTPTLVNVFVNGPTENGAQGSLFGFPAGMPYRDDARVGTPAQSFPWACDTSYVSFLSGRRCDASPLAN